jgi:hypothetical protein
MSKSAKSTNNTTSISIEEVNKPFGLAVFASADDLHVLQLLQQQFLDSFIPVAVNHSKVLQDSILTKDLLHEYLTKHCNLSRSEYSLVILLQRVQWQDNTIKSPDEFCLKLSAPQSLKIVQQQPKESIESLIHRIKLDLAPTLAELMQDSSHLNHNLTTGHDEAKLYAASVVKPLKSLSHALNYVILPSGAGLACFHRPGVKDFSMLCQHNTTHVLTLLGEREQPNTIRNLVKKNGITSLYIELRGANLALLGTEEILQSIASYCAEILHPLLLSAHTRLLLHCAAGIHRTGLITYTLLRMAGLSREKAYLALLLTRKATARQVGIHRLMLAEEVLLPRINKIMESKQQSSAVQLKIQE